MSSSFILELLILLLTVGFILYKLFTRNFDYWEKRNVPYPKPTPFFGNYYNIMTFQTTIGHDIKKLYDEFTTPYFGIFVLNKPHLVVKDQELIKSILVKDFNNFYDRTVLSSEECDAIFANALFVVRNPDWKVLRAKMTPVFTSGKMKAMFPLINDASLEMITYLEQHSSKSSLEAKDICAKYSTDVIATCAFGIQACSFKNENSEFRVTCKRMFDFSFSSAFRQVSYFILPDLVKLLRLSFFKPEVMDFFRDVFWKTIKLREKTKGKRNDLIDIIIQMKEQPDNSIDFSGDKVVAQAFMFFAAGFETTSSTMAFTLYELCLSPEIQSRARAEVKEILSKYKGFTYEAIKEMKYMHMLFCETLRKYPVLPFLDRICANDYKLPDTDLVVEKGTPVYIPVSGIHYDPEFYTEPEKYDPERFSEENRGRIPNFAHLPFGGGPRNCIGERFGLLVGKLGLARILSEYELERSLDTPVPLEYETKCLILASKVGLPMKFKKILSDAV
ncbi:hypothetical protein ILUMI_12409 [Ignelater luminosus]|uniref:Cytochrome P450 n=1 Tax=Ignelater luminosus TaxID=2038154 RepID=A0A8K0CWH8_IGNLU|nr:hypothetical protein ILUMI_12409 [Ignelater luminosus]